jgi:hypothetical protein
MDQGKIVNFETKVSKVGEQRGEYNRLSLFVEIVQNSQGKYGNYSSILNV